MRCCAVSIFFNLTKKIEKKKNAGIIVMLLKIENRKKLINTAIVTGFCTLSTRYF